MIGLLNPDGKLMAIMALYLRKVVFVALLITKIVALAQNPEVKSITGMVSDETGEPLASAHVVLLSFSDSTLVTFTTTDDQGRFSLNSPLGDYLIQARFVAYEPVTIKLLIDKEPLEPLSIQLQPKILKDVMVEGDRPVVIKKDTLEFDADPLKRDADRYVEDLLGRTPGVTIGENGKIYVKGAEVKDLLIEGTELYEDNPQLVTRTLSTSVLDKVQLIYDYDPDQTGSGRTAINLLINEEDKNRPLGRLEVGGGVPSKYKVASNMYLLGDHWKLNGIGNVNNMGLQTFSFRDYLNFSGILDEAISSGGGFFRLSEEELPANFSSDDIRAPEVKDQLLAVSANYQQNNLLNVQSYFILNHQNTVYREGKERNYIGLQGDAIYSEQDTSSISKALFDFSLKLNYQPHPKHALAYHFRWMPSSQQNRSVIQMDFENQSNRLNEWKKTTNQFLTNQFSWKYFLSPKDRISVKGTFNHSIPDHFYQLKAASNPYSDFIPDSSFVMSTPFSYSQRIVNERDQFFAEIRYDRKLGENWNVLTEAGWSHLEERTTQPTDNYEDTNLSELVNNASDYTFDHGHVKTELKYAEGILESSFALTLNRYDNQFEGRLNAYRQRKVLLAPKFNVRLQFSNQEKLDFSYFLSNKFPVGSQLNQAYLINDYRRLIEGDGKLDSYRTNTFRMIYYKYDLFHHTNFSAVMSWLHSRSPIGSNRVTTVNTDKEQYATIDGESKLQSMVSFSKDFFTWPVTLKGEIKVLHFSSQNMFNNELNDFSNSNLEGKVSLMTRYEKGLNVTSGLHFLRNDLETSVSQQKNTNLQYRPFVDIAYSGWKKLLIKLENTYVLFQSSGSKTQGAFMLNANFNYRISESFICNLECFNALNTHNLYESSVSSTFSQKKIRNTMERYITVLFAYQF